MIKKINIKDLAYLLARKKVEKNLRKVDTPHTNIALKSMLVNLLLKKPRRYSIKSMQII